MRIAAFAAVAALLTPLSGCGSLVGPGEVIGVVQTVEAPETVQAGETFTVTVQTTGPNGCWRKARTETSVSGLTVTITPYDLDSGGICTHAVVEIVHTAEVVFEQSGTGIIRVRGSHDSGTEISVEVL